MPEICHLKSSDHQCPVLVKAAAAEVGHRCFFVSALRWSDESTLCIRYRYGIDIFITIEHKEWTGQTTELGAKRRRLQWAFGQVKWWMDGKSWICLKSFHSIQLQNRQNRQMQNPLPRNHMVGLVFPKRSTNPLKHCGRDATGRQVAGRFRDLFLGGGGCWKQSGCGASQIAMHPKLEFQGSRPRYHPNFLNNLKKSLKSPPKMALKCLKWP